MGLFSKLFGGNKGGPGPMPTRKMQFQFDVNPQNGPRFAEQFRSAVLANENVELNYTAESIAFVDGFLQRFRDEGLTVNDFAETIFVAGCYVGQVMANQNGGIWIPQEEAGLPNGVTMTPIVIKLPNGTVTDPVAKAFKRFYNGNEDSLQFYYQVFA